MTLRTQRRSASRATLVTDHPSARRTGAASPPGQPLTVYVGRFTEILGKLQKQHKLGHRYRHTQCSGLVLAQLAGNPARTPQLLTMALDYVSLRGIEGVDGILLSLMAGAQYRDR